MKKNLETRLAQIEKEVQSDQYSAIPKSERILVVGAHTEAEYETKKNERLAALHRQYGHFDEGLITVIHIRKFSKTPPPT